MDKGLARIKDFPQLSWALAFGTMVSALGIPLLKANFIFDSSAIIVLALSPFVLYVPNRYNRSVRYGIAAIIALVLYPVFYVQTLFFIGLLFGMLFILEGFFGRVNKAAIYLVILASPVTSYFVKVLGFPVRLKLTKMAAWMLNVMGMPVEASGNEITLGTERFFVEPACMGLKLVVTGLVIALLMTSYYERKRATQIGHLGLISLLGLTLIMVVLANLARIVALIVFRSSPDSMSHELIGLLSLFLYVILPLGWIIPRLMMRLSWQESNTSRKSKVAMPFAIALCSAIVVQLVIVQLIYPKVKINQLDSIEADYKLPGFQTSRVGFGGFKFIDDDALIYVKPAKNFWSPDHNPIICWRGSGYQFQRERAANIAGQEVYIAELVKKEDKLYTAWWFENDQKRTIGELNWRFDMMFGSKGYDLINVSCENMDDLRLEVSRMIVESPLQRSY